MTEITISNNEQTSGTQLTNVIMDRLAQAIDETDEQAAAAKVTEVQAALPDATVDEWVNRLIMDKVKQTAVIGATTSGTMLIPGIGTLTALTVGMAADFSMTFKAQAELVLEIAAVYGRELTPEEKRRVVLLVTGLSAGTTAVAQRAGGRISRKITARITSKYVTKALPVVGIAASAATNSVMTWTIGKRAQAYFSGEPAAIPTWGEGWRAVSQTAQNAGRRLPRPKLKLSRPRLRRKTVPPPEEEEIIVVVPSFSKSPE
ncbi:MAG: DUF697 domain-containing protein [Chloroflexi bacterium]|nr:DUF697 domain-containing protein [Chloroflexota bacterium]